MPQDITATVVFTDPVTGPADGDLRNAASVNDTIAQTLANRTQNLALRTGGADASGEFTNLNPSGVATPKVRVRVVSPLELDTHSAQTGVGPASWYAPSGNAHLASIADFARLRIDLNKYLPDGAVLTGVLAVIAPGAARTVKTTLPGDNGRSWARVKRGTPDFATPGVTAYGADIGAVEDDGTTDVQHLSVAGLSETIAKSASFLWWEFIAGDDAGTNRDDIHALRITYTDPGPRNF